MRLFFRIAKIFSNLANVLILMKLTYSMKSLLVIWLKNFKTNSTFGKRILKKTGLEFGTFMFLRSFVTLFLARVTPITEFLVELVYTIWKNKWNWTTIFYFHSMSLVAHPFGRVQFQICVIVFFRHAQLKKSNRVFEIQNLTCPYQWATKDVKNNKINM